MKILSRPRGNAEEYGRWSVNPYKGCLHGCTYCYLKKGAWANGLGGDMPQMKAHVKDDNHAFHIAMCEIIEHCDEIIRDGGLFMTFTSDPLTEQTRDLSLRIANECQVYVGDIPVVMLTKAVGFWNSRDYYALRAAVRTTPEHTPVAFGWTLTGHDELEPNAPSNEARLRDMSIVSQDGFKTWASIEPVIDFPSSLRMIEQALDAGCQHFKIGLMTNNTRVCRDKYDEKECLQFISGVMRLTADRATVYWKRSFYDFLSRGSEELIICENMTTIELFGQWSHSVGKDWSMFNNK